MSQIQEYFLGVIHKKIEKQQAVPMSEFTGTKKYILRMVIYLRSLLHMSMLLKHSVNVYYFMSYN